MPPRRSTFEASIIEKRTYYITFLVSFGVTASQSLRFLSDLALLLLSIGRVGLGVVYN